ncbi:MAG: hypothetical protein P8172_09805 [Gammaproteobacteria bacterium]|jgi:hypothetical protein
MNWMMVTALASLAASIGVIVAVVLLTRHVRENTRALRTNLQRGPVSTHGNFADLIIQNPDLQDIYRHGRKSYWSLKDQDLYRFSNLAQKAFWYFSDLYYQHETGTLEEYQWQEGRAHLIYWLQAEGVRQWWQDFGSKSASPDFRRFVDGELERLGPIGRHKS